MKRFAFLCIFLFCSLLLCAQSNFLPGTITKSTGEIENGFVDYKEWAKNPSRISFKKGTDAIASSYSVDDLLGFEVMGKEKYIRASIKKDMMPVKINDLKVLPSVKVESVIAFVREIFRNDRIGLYIYRDFKDHFYVSETNGEFVELVYGVTANGEDVLENNAFRDQLLNYFPELRNKVKVTGNLERLRYRETDLTGFFYMATNTKAKPKQKIKPVFFAGTGIALSTLKVSGYNEISLMDYKTSISPFLFAGVDIITKRNLGAFVIRPQVYFYNLNYEGTYTKDALGGSKEEAKYVLKSTNFNVSLGGLYNFWIKPKQKVYAGLEVVGNFSKYKENELTRRNLTTGSVSEVYHLLEYESSWFSVNAMAGAVFMERFEIAVTARLTGSFSTMLGTNVKPSIYLLKLGYRF